MVASDGILRAGKGHPRGAGTFARVLGRYVRELKILTLQDAIRRMSLMPAQRLESVAPAMKNKGRIAVGADADLIVFDPDKVIDRATFEKPAEYSTGIRDVLVNGVFVVRGEKLIDGVRPGKPIRAYD
jgi:N-acyl-D-aspartate/D-glutamate deacylase